MNDRHLFLLHWEAQHPFDQIKQSLTNWKLPEEFSGKLFVALPQGYLQEASRSLAALKVVWGANDMANATPNSFTESVAAKLLQKNQAQFVLIGSAFKRYKIGETQASLRDKVRSALANNITPFLCFCCTDNVKANDSPSDAIRGQLNDVLTGLSDGDIQRIRFVYDIAPEKMSAAFLTSESLSKAYEACRQAYAELFKDDAGNITTLCAYPPYCSLNNSLVANNPFAGFYFKMTDTQLPQLI